MKTDRTPHFAASDLVLHCLSISCKRNLGLYGKAKMFSKCFYDLKKFIDFFSMNFHRDA